MEALAEWPRVTRTAVEQALALAAPPCLVALRRSSGLDARVPLATRLEAVRWDWDMSAFSRLLLRSRRERGGGLACVVTVGSFVVAGTDLTDVSAVGDGTSVLTLVEPGAWFDGFRGHRFPTGRGGPWLLIPPPLRTWDRWFVEQSRA